MWSGHGLYDRNLGPCLVTGDDYIDNKDYDFDEVIYLTNGEENGKCLITPKFVRNNVSDLTGSFMYLSTCSSFKDERLVCAFKKKNIAALVANTDIINTIYTSNLMACTINKMLEINDDTNDYYALEDALNFSKAQYGQKDSKIYVDEGAKDYAEAVVAVGNDYQFASNSKTTELSDGWYETVIVPDSEVTLYHEEDANGEYDIPVAYEAHIDGNMLYLTGGLALFASNDIDTDDIYYLQMPMEVLKYDDYSFEIQGSLSREADVINYYCSENGTSWQSTKNMLDMIKTGFEGDAVFQFLFIEIKNNVVIDAFVN